MLVWQHLIGIDIDWSVFPVSFMALIAVGADYSMLFAARIRDESADRMRRGILRSFGSTGSVITTAGRGFRADDVRPDERTGDQPAARSGSPSASGCSSTSPLVRTILVPGRDVADR